MRGVEDSRKSIKENNRMFPPGLYNEKKSDTGMTASGHARLVVWSHNKNVGKD